MVLTRDRSFYKSLIALSVPMMLQNLITFAVGLADNIMVGTLGDSAVSGVYLASQIQTVLQLLSAGIEGGVLLLAAQYWGKRDVVSIRRIVAIGVNFSIILGVIFTIVAALIPTQIMSIFTNETTALIEGEKYLALVCYSYIFFCITQSLIASMRSVESTKVGMNVSLISLVINIVLNYLFIFGKLGLPAMGTRGAALATLICRIVETVLMIVYVLVIDKKLLFRPHMLRHMDKLLLKDFVRYSAPIFAGWLVWGCNLIGSSIILGHHTEAVITATSLGNTISNLAHIGMTGMSGAVGIIIGKTVGSGDVSKIKEYSRTTQLIFLFFGIICGIFIFLIRDMFISLYSISDDAAFYSRQFINVMCFSAVGTFYQAGSLGGLVKSGGDVSFVFKNDTIFVFGVVLPSALICSLCGCAPWIVFLCLKSDQILKCAVAVVKIQKYNWMKNLTRDRELTETET